MFVLYVDIPNTTLISNSQLSVHEGESVVILCNSTGGPIPSITWTLNGHKTSFHQSDTFTSGRYSNSLSTASPGYVVSTLHLVNVQYPVHEGVYGCHGTIIVANSIVTSSVNITVKIGKLQ